MQWDKQRRIGRPMHENMKTSMWHTGRSERTCRLPACFLMNVKHGASQLYKFGGASNYLAPALKIVFLRSVPIQFFSTFLLQDVSSSHSAQRHRQTDGHADGQTDRRQHHASSRSYCVVVRSANIYCVCAFSCEVCRKCAKDELAFVHCSKMHDTVCLRTYYNFCFTLYNAYT